MIQLSPPQPNTVEEPPRTGLFSWRNLFSSTNLPNITRKNKTNQVEEPNINKSSEKSTPPPLDNNNILPDDGISNCKAVKTNIINNAVTKTLDKENNPSLENRKKNSSQIESEINQQPLKKVRFSNLQDQQNDHIEGNTSGNNNDQIAPENVHEANMTTPKKKNINKKELVKIPNSSFNIKSYISKISSNKTLTVPAAFKIQKDTQFSQNLKTVSSLKLSLNKQNVSEPLSFSEPIQPKPDSDNPKVQKEQLPTTQTLLVNNDAVDLFGDENQRDNMTCKCSILLLPSVLNYLFL